MGAALSCLKGMSGKKSKDTGNSEAIAWEKQLIDEKLWSCSMFSRLALLQLDTGEVRVKAPEDFSPDKNGINAILAALKGDSKAVARDGVTLVAATKPSSGTGAGAGVCSPGKLEPGTSLFGSDGLGGGCAVFQCQRSVLVGFYPSQPDICVRLLREVAEHITEQNH